MNKNYKKREFHIGDYNKSLIVTIIIPFYGKEIDFINICNNLLKNCIDQVEIIVVVDGKNLFDVKKYRKEFENCKNIKILQNKKNQGSGISRNIGIRRSRGRYIFFLDADDTFIGFENLISLCNIAICNRVKILGGVIKYNFENNISWFESVPIVNGFVHFSEFQNDYGYTRYLYLSQFIKKENFKFKDYRRYQDPPFLLEALYKVDTIYFVDKVSYIINVHEKKIWNSKEVDGLINGLEDNISFSKKNNLVECYRNNVRRVYADFGRVWNDDNPFIKKMNKLQKILTLDIKDMSFDVLEGEIYNLYYDQNTISLFIKEKTKVGCGESNVINGSLWRKYTDVYSISLILRVKGNGYVNCFKRIYGRNYFVARYKIEAPKKQYVHMDFQNINDGELYYFEVETSNSSLEIYEGFYINNYINTKSRINVITYRKHDYEYEIDVDIYINWDSIFLINSDFLSRLTIVQQENLFLFLEKMEGRKETFLNSAKKVKISILRKTRNHNIKYSANFIWLDVWQNKEEIGKIECMDSILEQWDNYAKVLVYSLSKDLNKKNRRQVILNLNKIFWKNIIMYKYEFIQFVLNALLNLYGYDSLNLVETNIVKNERLSNEELDYYRFCSEIKDCGWGHKIVRILTLNGFVRKASRNIILSMDEDDIVKTYKAKSIKYYDFITHDYVVEKKKKRLIMKFIFEFERVLMIVIKNSLI